MTQLNEFNLSSHEEDVLRRYLSALRGTQEAQKQRHYLARRVAYLLQLLTQDMRKNRPNTISSDIRIVLNNAMTSCCDRVNTGLDQVEQMQLIEQALLCPDRETLRQLAQRFYKRQFVHKHARKKVAQLIAVDELEVFLKFEIVLANRLALPIGTRHIYDEGCASCVTQDDLDLPNKKPSKRPTIPTGSILFLQHGHLGKPTYAASSNPSPGLVWLKRPCSPCIKRCSVGSAWNPMPSLMIL